jgi:hypothetical protein
MPSRQVGYQSPKEKTVPYSPNRAIVTKISVLSFIQKFLIQLPFSFIIAAARDITTGFNVHPILGVTT